MSIGTETGIETGIETTEIVTEIDSGSVNVTRCTKDSIRASSPWTALDTHDTEPDWLLPEVD